MKENTEVKCIITAKRKFFYPPPPNFNDYVTLPFDTESCLLHYGFFKYKNIYF